MQGHEVMFENVKRNKGSVDNQILTCKDVHNTLASRKSYNNEQYDKTECSYNVWETQMVEII